MGSYTLDLISEKILRLRPILSSTEVLPLLFSARFLNALQSYDHIRLNSLLISFLHQIVKILAIIPQELACDSNFTCISVSHTDKVYYFCLIGLLSICSYTENELMKPSKTLKWGSCMKTPVSCFFVCRE